MGLCGLALLMLACSMGYGGQVKARPQYTFYDSPFSTAPANFLLAKKMGSSSLSTSTSSLQLDGAAWASVPGGPGRWTLQDDDEGALPGLGAQCGSSTASVSIDPHVSAHLCCPLKAPLGAGMVCLSAQGPCWHPEAPLCLCGNVAGDQ